MTGPTAEHIGGYARAAERELRRDQDVARRGQLGPQVHLGEYGSVHAAAARAYVPGGFVWSQDHLLTFRGDILQLDPQAPVHAEPPRLEQRAHGFRRPRCLRRESVEGGDQLDGNVAPVSGGLRPYLVQVCAVLSDQPDPAGRVPVTRTGGDGAYVDLPTVPAAVMSAMLARDPLYGTGAARRRWEAMARANIARELESITGTAPPC